MKFKHLILSAGRWQENQPTQRPSPAPSNASNSAKMSSSDQGWLWISHYQGFHLVHQLEAWDMYQLNTHFINFSEIITELCWACPMGWWGFNRHCRTFWLYPATASLSHLPQIVSAGLQYQIQFLFTVFPGFVSILIASRWEHPERNEMASWLPLTSSFACSSWQGVRCGPSSIWSLSMLYWLSVGETIQQCLSIMLFVY